MKIPAGLSGASVSPASLSKLPAAVHAGYVQAYAHSLQTVFLVAVPISAVGLRAHLAAARAHLRKTTQAVDPGDTYALPKHRSSLQELERALTVLASREHRRELFARLTARAQLTLAAVQSWLLLRIDRHPDWDAARLAREPAVGVERVVAAIGGMADGGLLSVADGAGHGVHEHPRLTTQGRAAVDALQEARRQGLTELLEGWSPEEHDELCRLIDRLTRELLDDEEAPDGDGGAPPAAPTATAAPA